MRIFLENCLLTYSVVVVAVDNMLPVLRKVSHHSGITFATNKISKNAKPAAEERKKTTTCKKWYYCRGYTLVNEKEKLDTKAKRN